MYCRKEPAGSDPRAKRFWEPAASAEALGRKEHGLLETQNESFTGVPCAEIQEATRAPLVVTVPAMDIMMHLKAAGQATCCTK